MDNMKQRFLENTDDTGRFMVCSQKTGIKYFVEPLDSKERRSWGDQIPGADRIEGDYGTKNKGSIDKKESLITEENGFKNIEILEMGVSPHGTIREIDDLRYEQGFRPK